MADDGRISAKQVMDLRAATGLSMMKCKEALLAEHGDFEKAVERLRKEGLKTADSKAGRATGEGLVRMKIAADGLSGTLVAVLCETEPVARTPMFIEFVDGLLAHADARKPASVEALLAQPWLHEQAGRPARTVDEVLRGLIAQIGENMKVAGVWRLEAKAPGLVAGYVHHNQKAAALVAVDAAKPHPNLAETARQLAMHVVFAKPAAATRAGIAAEVVAKEREIFREQMAQDPKMKAKPAPVLEKILDGKVDAFYKERVLVEQAWFRPEVPQSVTQVLQAVGATYRGHALALVGGA